MDKNTLISNLLTYKYISFDLYDTLIVRTVPKPTDIFEIVQYYATESGLQIKNFKEMRILAEQKTRASMPGKEVTLDLIYKNLPYTERERNLYKKIEIECEIKNCLPNPLMIEVLKSCQKAGKTIFITSDMYLPRVVIDCIINKIGVTYNEMFLSCEYGVNKDSGKLFDVILEKLGEEKSMLAHIGDNEIKDIKTPSSKGIHSFLTIYNPLIEPQYFCEKHTNIFQKHINSFLSRESQFYKNNSPEYNIGYKVIGPLLYEFCEWLHEMKLKHNLDKLFFVAREGFFIKECYSLLYPEDSNITHYIYLNKNVLRLPVVSIDRSFFKKTLNGGSSINWDILFRYTGVEECSYEKIKEQLSTLFENICFKDEILVSDIERGLYDEQIESLLSLQKDYIAQQSDMLKEYLDENCACSGRIGLVNNSINGSGQFLLETYASAKNMDIQIFGLQFQDSPKCRARLQDRFEKFVRKDYSQSIKSLFFKDYSLILEHLLFKEEGTALKFYRETERGVKVQLEELRNEKKNYLFINTLQDFARRFIIDYKKCLDLPLQEFGYESWCQLLMKPDVQDAKMICALYDDNQEGDRQLVDLSQGINSIMILKRNIPKTIWWINGYIIAKELPSKYEIWNRFISSAYFYLRMMKNNIRRFCR